MPAQEPSLLSSVASCSATDLSKRTDRTHYTVPDDGREITLHTNRRRRKNADTESNLSHATNTSLLIEYFEQGKSPGSSGHRPSVRVKVTPSAAKRHGIKQNGQGLQISEVGSRAESSRSTRQRPTHVTRVSLSPHNGEDRLTLGEALSGDRNRSYSGDHSTLESLTSGGEDHPRHHYGNLNVTVVREAESAGSLMSSPRDLEIEYGSQRRRRTRPAPSRNGTIDSYFGDQPLKVSKQRRSRSVSRDMDVEEETVPKTVKMERRRSRSLSRDRGSMSQVEKQMIEQRVKEELERLRNPKSRKTRAGSRTNKGYDQGLKPAHARERSRSRDQLDDLAAEKLRARRKAEQIEGYTPRNSSSAITSNPALISLIQDTIKQMVLPEIEELKSQQRQASGTGPLALSRNNSKRPTKASSLPEVGKPIVVLSPDVDQGAGQGVVLAGGSNEKKQEADSVSVSETRALGLGLGPMVAHSPLHSEADAGEGVSLVGTMPPEAHNGEKLEMPEEPFRADTPASNAQTRASILTAKSGAPPYPAQSSGMPSSGTPPPAPGQNNTTSPQPRENFPELDLNHTDNYDSNHQPSIHSRRSRDDELSVHSNAISLSRYGDPPSIASFHEGDPHLHDHDDRASATSSVNKPATTAAVRSAYSDLSIESFEQPPSTVLAKERKDRRRKKGVEEMSEIREGDQNSLDESRSGRGVSSVDLFFAEQREREQQNALMNPGFQDTSLEVRHLTTMPNKQDFDGNFDKYADGQTVYPLGANPSMRSTPDVAHSAHASVLNPSNLDMMSNLSFRQNSRPLLTASALPIPGSPMPEYDHLDDEEDDDEVDTNPSIIQGPIQGQPTEWDLNHTPSHVEPDDLGITTTRAIPLEDLPEELRESDPRAASHLAPTPTKDEGYISSNQFGSPGTVTPEFGVRGMGGIDDMLDEVDYLPGHRRFGSGNSHGMPSPLYDSSTGRGIERIQSKDIVALMEHLTVRDAQRNARDTEILVTLVRSAAEMRNSFEDMKRQLEDSQRHIIQEVDQNTERSVQKVLQGPRPLPPSAPRRPRYSKSEEDGDDEGSAKRKSIFKRALKGLSSRSSNDLEKIEEMLCKLLDEVEGLKDGQQFYQQSIMHSQSMNTIENNKSLQDSQENGPVSSYAGNSGYVSGVPSRQPSGKMAQDPMQHPVPHSANVISPIQEDAVLDTPPRQYRGESLPLDTPPHAKIPLASASLGNTPTKSEKQKETHTKRESGSSSIFPRISRWSETTNGSGFKSFLGRGKDKQDGSETSRSQPDFNFWETDAGKAQQSSQFNSPYLSEGQATPRAMSPLLPPSSRDTDAPINHSNRRSLDIQHPQPRQTVSHHLEAKAQQIIDGGGMIANSPNNNSVSSLGTFPPIGPGGFQNGKLLSPLAQDAYAQHQAQTTPNGPPRPPKIREQPSADTDMANGGADSPRREKKHRERDENGRKIKKERTEEEKQRRRERKERKERGRDSMGGSPASRKKSKDYLSTDGGDASLAGRSISNASRLNGPRPLSNASNKENSRRHRHTNSHATDDTFGNNYEREVYANYR